MGLSIALAGLAIAATLVACTGQKAPIDISYGEHTLTEGTYSFTWEKGEPPLVFEVPAGVELEIRGVTLDAEAVNSEGELISSGIGLILDDVDSDSFITLDVGLGTEWKRYIGDSNRKELGALFDQIVESARVQE